MEYNDINTCKNCGAIVDISQMKWRFVLGVRIIFHMKQNER